MNKKDVPKYLSLLILVYCYLAMAFGLKNVGVTYQRLVNKIFEHLVGKTVEVYEDDMLVKSLDKANHIEHLRETFEVLGTT